MQNIYTIFSTREIALIIWGIIAFILMMTGPKIRIAFYRVIQVAFFGKLFISFTCMIIYIAIIVYLLYCIDVWNTSLLKDTIIWTFFFASTTFFNLNKVVDTKYFKKLLTDSLKWTLLIEYLINFHTFSLIIELIILPFMLFIVAMQVSSEIDKQYEVVNKLFTGILSMFGISIFLYSLIQTIYKSNELFTFSNFHEFLLPLYMTILLMPFLYLIALFIQYESLFVRVRFMTS